MDLEREFDKRIAAIHGLDNPVRDGSIIREGAMDIRHAEFEAMAGVFLGDDFDGGKLWLVESLQTALHHRQAELYRHLEAREMDPEQYVESFNALLEDTFAACEAILGSKDFLKLFGVPRSELAGFIDRETFLQANQQDELNDRAAQILTFPIPVDKIPALIGQGSHAIREFAESTGGTIDVGYTIDADGYTGRVNIASMSLEQAEACKRVIEQITAAPEVNKTYLGTVQRIADFGAFVEILPGTDGLLHISDIADYRVRDIRDELTEGQQLLVKVVRVDPSGKIRLSHKAVLRDQRREMREQDDEPDFDGELGEDQHQENPGPREESGPGVQRRGFDRRRRPPRGSRP